MIAGFFDKKWKSLHQYFVQILFLLQVDILFPTN